MPHCVAAVPAAVAEVLDSTGQNPDVGKAEMLPRVLAAREETVRLRICLFDDPPRLSCVLLR